MNAVFLDYGTVNRGDLDTGALDRVMPMLRYFEHSTEEEILERTSNAEIALLNKAVLGGAVFDAAPRLKLVVLAATGTNNIDLAAAARRGVGVCNIRGYCTSSVAQHVWGTILMLTHHLHDHARLAADGAWARSDSFTLLSLPIRELQGKILGIVGWGELGRAVANIGAAFGMQVLAAESLAQGSASESNSPPRLELKELLKRADVLSLHCPLTERTRGMIGAAELASMKPDALLINTARGALVDGNALAEALRAGRLGGAGIDVLPQEPPVNGDPLLMPGIPNLVVTPHIAWAAREARQRCIDEMAANVEDFLAGGRRGRVV